MRRFVFIGLPLVAGCWAGEIRSRAAMDLGCSEAEIDVQTGSSYKAIYDVQGCGKHATYIVRNDQPMLQSNPAFAPAVQPASPAPQQAPVPAIGPAPTAAPALATPAPQPAQVPAVQMAPQTG